MDWEDLVDPIVAERARRAAAGHDETLRLALGTLVPGAVGVVEAQIVAIGLPRTFTRKRGGEGRLLKVALRDTTGEADLVLWDEEAARAAAWRPGLSLRLRGAVVKAGRDGPELGLGAARVDIVEASHGEPLNGFLVALSPDRRVEDAGQVRVQAEAELATSTELATLVVEGATVAHLRGLPPGTRLAWEAVRRHPVLEGWFIATPDALPGPSQTAK